MGIERDLLQAVRKMAAERRLHPGDRLPTCETFRKMLGISYTSCQRGLKKLENRGIVEIRRGSGTYLAGGTPLKVDLFVSGSTFDLLRVQALATECAVRNDLNMEIFVREKDELNTHPLQEYPGKAAIVEDNGWLPVKGTLLDLSSLPGYSAFSAEFETFGSRLNNLQLPFYCVTWQACVNLRVLNRLGIREVPEDIAGLPFSPRWDRLVQRCREHNCHPALRESGNSNLWNFPGMFPTLLMQAAKREKEDELLRIPVFDTSSGERLFHFLRESYPCENPYEEFCRGNTALLLQTGSWFTEQSRLRNGFRDECRILPLRSGGRKIIPYSFYFLQTYLRAPLGTNETERIWKFLRLLCGREMQKQLTALSGAISLRKDLKSADHAWADREDFLEFFPGKRDFPIRMNADLTNEERVALGVLYEQHARFGADSALIRKCMDEKLAVRHPALPFRGNG